MNSEPSDWVENAPSESNAAPQTAWALLRQLREERKVSIVTLASSLKVPTKYLTALESGDIDVLPDAVFARALAAGVCRHMGVAPETVLSLWPQVENPTMARTRSYVSITPTQFDPYHRNQSKWRRVGLVVLAVVIVAGLWWLRSSQMNQALPGTGDGSAASQAPVATLDVQPVKADGPIAEQASQGAPQPVNGATVTTQVLSAPVDPKNAATEPAGAVAADSSPSASNLPTPVATAAAVTPAPVSDVLQITASKRAWVDVRSQSGEVLISRNLAAGEVFETTEGAPWFVVLGRANAVQVMRNGESVDLTPKTQGNVARLQVE